jgi:hypothetical protein
MQHDPNIDALFCTTYYLVLNIFLYYYEIAKITCIYQNSLRSGPYLSFFYNSVQTKVDETRQCIVQKESNSLSVLVHKGMF